MARKQRYWAPALADACELLLVLDAAVFGRPVKAERPRITWPEETATPQEVAQTLALLRTAEAASTEVMVRMLHADWDDEAVTAEVERIQAERGAPVPEPAF